MKNLKQWLTKLLRLPALGKKLDQVDESSEESFPASDPPAWAGWESKKVARLSGDHNNDPVAILKQEHRAIMTVIYLMHEQVERLQHNQPAQPAILKNISAFLREFLEKNHYQKEEALLLPALEQSGAPLTDCPMALLKQDHALSLSLLATLEKLLPACEKNEPAIREKLIDTLTELKDIYTRHTLKTENFIFPLAEKYLSPEAQKSLSEAFAKMDQKKGISA